MNNQVKAWFMTRLKVITTIAITVSAVIGAIVAWNTMGLWTPASASDLAEEAERLDESIEYNFEQVQQGYMEQMQVLSDFSTDTRQLVIGERWRRLKKEQVALRIVVAENPTDADFLMELELLDLEIKLLEEQNGILRKMKNGTGIN